jgi:hypothetical protein
MRMWQRTPGKLGSFLAVILCTWTWQTAAAVVIEPPSLQPAAQEPVYFLAAELPRGGGVGPAPAAAAPLHDSFVLSLTEPQHVAHARRLVAEGISAGQPTAVARIGVGGDGINGDWQSPGTRPWSWHISEFLGFADVVIAIYGGGSPTKIEENLPRLPLNGVNAFFGYTVVRELPRMPPLPGDANLDGSVNGSDFSVLASNFGRTTQPDWGRADFNQDGSVDGTDFGLLASNYGRSAPGAAGGVGVLSVSVPEPASAWVLALAAPLLRRRRD